MADLTIDRHVLASPATAYDTAWTSYGWSPALEGPRASRLEEVVPWGSRTARMDDPPRLSGPAERIIEPSHRDRLSSALLHTDDGLAYSVWGAVGRERVGSEWRVITHTLLFDASAFRQMAGYPDGLLGLDGRPAPWLRELTEERDFATPTELEPVRLGVDAVGRRRFARARLDEVRRLRDVHLDGPDDVADLEALLASVYEGLARTLQESRTGTRYVAIPGAGAPVARLLRLVWLTLPLEDRVRVSYVTEQRKAEHPPAHLLGLPPEEWGRFVPEAAWTPGSEALEPGPGRCEWARRVADPAAWDDFVELDRRAEGRGWRLVAADDLKDTGLHRRWARGWSRDGPSLEAVERRLRLERDRQGGRVRAAALGRVLAEALGPTGAGSRTEPQPGADPDADLDGALELAAGLPAPERADLLRGVVRGLRAGGPRGRVRAGRLRCRAAARWPDLGGSRPALHRLVDREVDALRALVATPGGAVELLAGGLGSAASDPVARELVRLAAAEAEWSGGDLERVVDLAGDAADPVLADLLLTIVREERDAGVVRRVAGALLPTLEAGSLTELSDDLVETLTPAGSAGWALRDEALLEIGRRGGSGVDATVTARLIRAHRAGPWRELVEEAPPTWLARGPVLAALVATFGPGEETAGAPGFGTSAHGEVARRLVARILELAGASGMPDDRAEAVLRLLWTAGDVEPIRSLVAERPDVAVPVLSQLLVLPAPMPLFSELRALLEDVLEAGASTRGVETWAPGLQRYAPAVSERLGLTATWAGPPSSSLVLLSRGRLS